MKNRMNKIALKSTAFVLLGAMSLSSITFANEEMKKGMTTEPTTKPAMEMMAKASTDRLGIETLIMTLKTEKQVLVDALAAFELQHHAATAANDLTLIATIEASIATTKAEIALKDEAIMTAMTSLKNAVHREFPSDVVMKNMKLKAEINKMYPGMQVLDMESIVATGHKFNFNAPPVMKDDHILMPVKTMAEAFGATVAWNAETRTVTLVKDAKTIEIHLNSNEVHVNGVKAEIVIPAMSMKGNMYVPISFIANEFGLDFTWHKDIKMGELTHKSTPVTTPVDSATQAPDGEEHKH